MATLRPPSTSPSPSPVANENGRHANSRASMGPSTHQGIAPASPRPGGVSGAGRPTSELLGGAGLFQTPEAEAIDQWFENLQNYEVTLEEMAAASLDVNFKEELSAIEQWFKVLSEAERTAALYSLLQHSKQVQIRFFITVLQQMARSDPMTALLSPGMGGSMQTQMEAKLASMNLKSPGLKSPLPSSPSARNFSAPSANRQSLALDSLPSNYLSPDAANVGSPSAGSDAANTLAQQRAKLKANTAHRISAPVLSTGGVDGRTTWGPASQLGQVVEATSSSAAGVSQDATSTGTGTRPKSTEFSGTLGSPGLDSALSPMVGGSWASMVNTPLVPIFPKESRNGATQNLDAAAASLNEWAAGGRVPLMGDPKKFRVSKGAAAQDGGSTGAGQGGQGQNGGVYGDDGNLIVQGAQQSGPQQQQQRNVSGGMRNASGGSGFNGAGGWQGARSPALSNGSSNRFGSDDGGIGINNNSHNIVPNTIPHNGNNNNPGGAGGMNGLGMGGYNMGGLGSPGLGMSLPGAGGLGMAGLAGIGQMSPLMNMNMMNLAALGISPEAQLLAAQMAANGFGAQPGGWMGMQGQGRNGMNVGMGMGVGMGGVGGGGRGGGRSPGVKTPSASGRSDAGGKKGDEEDVDPQLLNDVPAWLRSLRLHKYTPNFEGMRWQDMVALDEAALEGKGVAALGARRKMLKTFEVVRKKMGIESPT